MKPISRQEWRWVATCAVVLAILVAVPYGIALLRPPDGFLLARTLYYGDDLSQYLAAMGDGATSSSWLIQDHLTAEPHDPAFMYPFYVLLGKVAALAGVPPIPIFGLAVVLAIPALVFAAYAFAATFADSTSERKSAVLFMLFASGVGIWVAAAAASESSTGSVGVTFSFDRAEVTTFLLPFGPPHLPLALALLMVWARALAVWSSGGPRRWLAVLVLTLLGVALLNPFSLATMVALASGYALVRWLSARSFPLREIVAAAVVAAVAAPLLAANLATFAMNPFWSLTYGQQNTTTSPAPWVLALDFGLLLPLAVAGAVSPRPRREARLLLAFWVLALLVLMYLPVPYQRRFGFGLQPALAVLAALGVSWVGDMLKASARPTRSSKTESVSPLRLGFRALVATVLFSGTMLGFALMLMASAGEGPLGAAIFEPRGNVAAADWLVTHSDSRDVILASTQTGNYLAGRIRGRVVVGHKAGTLDEPAKEELVREFFRPATTAGDRWQMAASQRVTFVLVGKRERALGAPVLRSEDGFRPVYDADGVQIYRVTSPQ